MLRELIIHWYGLPTYNTIAFIFYLSPIWLPIALGLLFWETWLRYIRYLFFAKTKYILLEIKLPREIARTPESMEIVLSSLYQTGGEGTFIDRYWDGKVRPWFSLEIVSDAGTVSFYIWTREGYKNLIESNIYSQFPEVEVTEVPDYTFNFKFDPKKNDLWSCRYQLAKPDPLPIKTYLDYGLDNTMTEEQFKIDPIAPIIEFLSSIKQGEKIWLQIVIRAHKKEKHGGIFSKAENWQKKVDEKRKEFLAQAKEAGQTRLSEAEQRILDAFNRRVQKFAFDCGMRCIYAADNKDSFNKGNVGGLKGLLRPFSMSLPSDLESDKRYYAAYNAFKTAGATEFDYPWEDYKDRRLNKHKKSALDAYKRRMFFYIPYKKKTFVFTTEELATLFHFPGAAVSAPGLPRIPSKRGQAPANLPV